MTAYLLCRHLTRSLWASLVGGYLFGFSGYMLGQEQGHLHMTAVFLLPLIALAVVRYLQGELDGRGVAWRLGVLFGLQFWLSTELLLTASLALGVALVLAFWLVPATRPRLRALVRPLLAAVGIAARRRRAAPVLRGDRASSRARSTSRATFDGDLLNFVVPTHLDLDRRRDLRAPRSAFRGNDAEQGAYLGIPTLVIVGLVRCSASAARAVARFLARRARRRAFVLTLGTGLVVEGARSSLRSALDGRSRGCRSSNNVLPARFARLPRSSPPSIVALWTAGRHGLDAVACCRRSPSPRSCPTVAQATTGPCTRSAGRSSPRDVQALLPEERERRDLPLRLLGRLDALAGRDAASGSGCPEGYLAPEPAARRTSPSDPLIRW